LGGGFEGALPRLLSSALPPPGQAQVLAHAPQALRIAPKDGSLPQASWLAAEALRIEEKAAQLDRHGSSAEAMFHHRRASLKLKEAAALCPNGHPDKMALEGHAQDIATRSVYLESLGGAPPTLALEDHVGELEQLTLDLTIGAPPPEQEVAVLVAGAGVSGSSAPITEDGFQLVVALQNDEELRTYILRVLESEWRQPKDGKVDVAELNKLLPDRTAQGTLDQLCDRLRCAPWVELNMDPKLDRLQMGVALEKEARELDAQGRKHEALQAYEQSLGVLQLVYKFDQRCKNPKIKEMVGKRMGELRERLQDLKSLAEQ